MRISHFAFLLAVLCAPGAIGQVSTTNDSNTQNGFRGSASFSAPNPFEMRSITGAPYSAEETNSRIQT